MGSLPFFDSGFEPNAILLVTLVVFATLAVVAIAARLLRAAFANQPQNRLYRQLSYVALAIISQVVLVIVLPLEEATKSQLLTLFGYAMTAIVALSSTSFVSNAMAGLMLKAMGTFHTGDFIRVENHFGRVTAKALLHTEIQSEDRDAIALPNLFVITNPVQVVDQTGTLISAEVGIGYDTHHQKVKESLTRAAEAAGLNEPFVQILDLGDFAVRYKITGFLEDVTNLVSKRSELKAHMLDTLHGDGVEIMTPNVMSQRPLATEVVPDVIAAPAADADAETGKAERMMFDKAELAARIERFREQSNTLTEEIAKLRDADAKANAAEIAWREHQLASLQEIVSKFEENDG